MLDKRAVTAFADNFGFRALEYNYTQGRKQYRVFVTHLRASEAYRRMWPFLEMTDKGDQIRTAFVTCEYTYSELLGWWLPPSGRRSEGMKGNTNVRGKTWSRKDPRVTG